MNTIKDVQRWLDNISDINAGGCGISALAMYRWLKKNNQLAGDESFTYLYCDKDENFKVNSKVLTTKQLFSLRRRKKMGSASHIMLFHNGVNIDSEGSHIQSRYGERHEGIVEKLLVESIQFGGWNSSFNREYFVPKIASKLGVDLSDVNIN